MARVLERLEEPSNRHNPQTKLIETKIMPFMDYIDQQMQQLKEHHLTDTEQLSKSLIDTKKSVPCRSK